MRPMLLVVIALLVPTLAVASGWVNEIGIYVDAETVPHWAENNLVAPTAGAYDLYLFCENPENWDPINLATMVSTVGGFELTIELPGGWFVQSSTLPPDAINFSPRPDSFYCSGRFPVVPAYPQGSYPVRAYLATVTIATYEDPPPSGSVFLRPYVVAPSLPGYMAVTDADDEFDLIPVHPASGDYDLPVLGINASFAVSTEDATWSDLKALYR